ncbi:MAG: sugar phosphate isomerase/epimerase [Candidatus Cloacimonetes bacterium]|nr:sugar phosphate isomerase/epimerase [Candidatus Cloacimonadota bacterium]
MIRLAASSMFFHEYEPQDIFAAVDKAGADTIEFWMETPTFWMRGANVSELIELLDLYPTFAKIAMHAPVFELNPCSFNAKVADLTAEYTLACMDILEQLGGGVLTIHPGKRTSKRPISPIDKERFVHYIERVGNAAVGSSVTVALENMPPAVNAHMVTAKEIRTVLDEYAWLSFTWDYAHACLAGDPFSFPRECGERIVNIHTSKGDRRSMHSPLAGTLEAAALRTVLSEIGYGGLMTFELEDLSLEPNGSTLCFRPISYEEKIAILTREVEEFSRCRCI